MREHVSEGQHKMLKDEDDVNLGVWMPTLVANYIPEDLKHNLTK